MIFPEFFFIVHLYQNLHQLAEHIDAKTPLPSDRPSVDHAVADTRKSAVEILVGLFLILQAAHQSSAHTGDLGRIQRKILLFCHLDGNRRKLGQIGVAAQRSSADTDSAHDLCLIAHTDLAKLDSGA